MSTGKLDKSLDEILSSQRRAVTSRRRSTRRSSASKGTAPAAPAGGVQKQKGAHAAAKAPARATGAVGESKVMVSNLPKDVSEQQIKVYFQQSVGQVKKVDLSYGPGGVSRGIAHITFHHADSASKAFKVVNGILIDNRPVKVEVVVSSAALIPEPKTLGQRVTQKAQPKSAANVKHGAVAKGPAGKAAAKKAPRKGRNSRPTKKTVEELDADMQDYYQVGNNENANAGAAAPANGDATMVDEIS